ncbi:MAG: serine acetyltransferase [Acidobacteriota bacterium]|nr:serine acetyltransferase [Acidobacteriota bacterium]
MLREQLKSIRDSIGRSWVLPMLVPFSVSRNRQIILADVRRWAALEHIETRSETAALLHLLCFYKEFRNLYYYRLKQNDVLGNVLAALFKLIYKEPSWLVIRPRELGPGFFVQHGVGTNVNGERIGANCRVNQQATIGFGNTDRLPRLGDNVHIGAGARVLGDLTIGDNVIVGANAVVTKNVPANCTVVGIPARIVRRDGVRVDEAL